jgi:hypothetical protein
MLCRRRWNCVDEWVSHLGRLDRELDSVVVEIPSPRAVLEEVSLERIDGCRGCQDDDGVLQEQQASDEPAVHLTRFMVLNRQFFGATVGSEPLVQVNRLRNVRLRSWI